MTDLDPRWSDAIRCAGTIPVDLDTDWARVRARVAADPAVRRMDARPFRIPPRRQALAAAAVVVLLAGVVGALALRDRGGQDVDSVDQTTTPTAAGPPLADVVVPTPTIDWVITIGPKVLDDLPDVGLGETCVATKIVGSSGGGAGCGPSVGLEVGDQAGTECATDVDSSPEESGRHGVCVWETVAPRDAPVLARSRLAGQAPGPYQDLADVSGVRQDHLVVGDRPVTAYSFVLRPVAQGSGGGLDGIELEARARPDLPAPAPTTVPAGTTVEELVLHDVWDDWQVLPGLQEPGEAAGDWCVRLEMGASGFGTCTPPTDADPLLQFTTSWPTEDPAVEPPSEPGAQVLVVGVPAGRRVTVQRSGADAAPAVDLDSVSGVGVYSLDVEGQPFDVYTLPYRSPVDGDAGSGRPVMDPIRVALGEGP